MFGKAARIRSIICDVILCLVTKRHLDREHNLHKSEKYFWMGIPQDLFSGMPLVLLEKITHLPLKQYIPGPPSAQLSKLIRLNAWKKTKYRVSQWYRTVYIPWLVASYDTQKGKRLLNSNPQTTEAKGRSEHCSFKHTRKIIYWNILSTLIW